jgi:hypothetical protein
MIQVHEGAERSTTIREALAGFEMVKGGTILWVKG